MTEKELAKMMYANVGDISGKDLESLQSKIDAVIASIQSGTDHYESFIDLYLSAVRTGAMVAIQTLIDIGIVKFSE